MISLPDQSRASKALLGGETGSRFFRCPAAPFTFHSPLFPSPDSSLCLAAQNSREIWASCTPRPSGSAPFSRGCRQGRARHGGR